MQMEKPSEKTIAIFNAIAQGGPLAEVKKMFGQPYAAVNGNMFMGLFGDHIHVRLSAEEREAALKAGAAPFEPMGRAMKEYVLVPAAVVADPDQLSEWVARAYRYGLTLKPKEPKPRKR